MAKRCAICRQPLLGEYIVDHWGTEICAKHEKEVIPCAYCGRLMTNTRTRGLEDAPRCSECILQAVDSPIKARLPLQSVLAWFAHRDLSLEQSEVPLELCDRRVLDGYAQSSESKHLGITRVITERSRGRSFRRVERIAILRGLPVALFQGVVAHELGHAWLHKNDIHNLAAKSEEGFCELLSHMFYRQATGPGAAYYARTVEENRHPVYRGGFREMQERVKRRGFAVFLSEVRKSGTIS